MDYDNFGDGGFNVDAQYSEYNNSQRQQTRSSLSPVTIKEINDATQPVPDGEFVIHNVSLNMVSFVGIIRKVESNSSAITITLEDGTGSMDVKRWIDEKISSASEETEKFSALENKYVFVTGALKEFNSKKSIQHAVIREVTDHNEIAYHMLYAISNYMEAQGLLSKGKGAKKEENGLFVKDSENGSNGANDITTRIEKVITENTGSMQEGVPISWISETLGVPLDVVRDQCQNLSEQGKIYQGYDEGSFLSVNA